MKKLKVSVIVNFYNGEKYLYQSLKSIIEQNYKNLEIILWDNCSTDKSVDIVKLFSDNRIKYFLNKKKVSLYKARNDAVKASSGQLIAFLDSDDIWKNDKLETQITFMEKKKLMFSHTSYIIIDRYNKIKKLNKSLRNLYPENLFTFIPFKYLSNKTK